MLLGESFESVGTLVLSVLPFKDDLHSRNSLVVEGAMVESPNPPRKASVMWNPAMTYHFAFPKRVGCCRTTVASK